MDTITNPKAFLQTRLPHNATTINDFDGLIRATKSDSVFDTIIQGHTVRLIPNFFSSRDLFSLYINNCLSNSCLGGAMRKLIKDWKDGKLIAREFDSQTFLTKS